MIVDLSTPIALPPEQVWLAVQKPELLRHIAAPLVRFRPVANQQWPAHFTRDQPIAVNLWLFGILSLGRQWIVPSLHPPSDGLWPQRLRDNGHSGMIRRWDHWITIAPDDQGGTRYRDVVKVDAGALTPVVGLFARLFYRHRQRRWRGLADRLSIYSIIWDEQENFRAARQSKNTATAWDALKTIHILAQPYFAPHWSSHIAMLRFAVRQRDWREVGGQLLRLALVPLGSATGRLPVGNHGRARVSPFRSMKMPPDLELRLALNGVALPSEPMRDTR